REETMATMDQHPETSGDDTTPTHPEGPGNQSQQSLFSHGGSPSPHPSGEAQGASASTAGESGSAAPTSAPFGMLYQAPDPSTVPSGPRRSAPEADDRGEESGADEGRSRSSRNRRSGGGGAESSDSANRQRGAEESKEGSGEDTESDSTSDDTSE